MIQPVSQFAKFGLNALELGALELGSMWMLGWLAAAGIPLALHLLHRRRQQEVHWAAMELLLHAIQQNSRTLRIEGWLLLLLRTLALILFALALARPLWVGNTNGSSVVAQPPRLWVIVLDASYSMGYTPGRQSLFQQAQAAAVETVSQAAANDAFLLVQLSEPSQSLISQPAFDSQRVISEIQRLKCSDGSGDLNSCLEVLRHTIDDADQVVSSDNHVHIVFFTDMGRDAWEAATREPLKRELQALSNRYHVQLESFAVESPQNLAITALEADSSMVWKDKPLRCSATIHNYSTSAATRLPIQFQSDGSTLQTEFVDCPPGQSRSVTVELQAGNRSVWSLSAAIPDDRLQVDNRRDLVVAVKPKIRVITVEDVPGASRLVNLSLAPGASEAKGTSAGRAVTVETWSSFDLQSKPLTDVSAVILTDIADVSATSITKLKNFVMAGGSLLVLAGPRTQAAAWNQADPSMRQLVGLRLSEPSLVGDWHIDSLNYSSPIARPFANYLDSGLLTTPVFRYWKVAPSDDHANDVSTNYSSEFVTDLALEGGDPLLIRRAVGDGWIAVMLSAPQSGSKATDEAMNWNAMATWPSFVPIMQKTIETLVGGSEGQLNLTVGQPLRGSTSSIAPSLELVVERPDHAQSRMAVPLPASGNRRTWFYSATDRAGIYKVSLNVPQSSANSKPSPQNETGDQPLAVNIQPDQSDMVSMNPNILSLADAPQASSTAKKSITSSDDHRPNEWLVHLCLWALLATLISESLLAWHLGRRLNLGKSVSVR